MPFVHDLRGRAHDCWLARAARACARRVPERRVARAARDAADGQVAAERRRVGTRERQRAVGERLHAVSAAAAHGRARRALVARAQHRALRADVVVAAKRLCDAARDSAAGAHARRRRTNLRAGGRGRTHRVAWCRGSPRTHGPRRRPSSNPRTRRSRRRRSSSSATRSCAQAPTTSRVPCQSGARARARMRRTFANHTFAMSVPLPRRTPLTVTVTLPSIVPSAGNTDVRLPAARARHVSCAVRWRARAADDHGGVRSL